MAALPTPHGGGGGRRLLPLSGSSGDGAGAAITGTGAAARRPLLLSAAAAGGPRQLPQQAARPLSFPPPPPALLLAAARVAAARRAAAGGLVAAPAAAAAAAAGPAGAGAGAGAAAAEGARAFPQPPFPHGHGRRGPLLPPPRVATPPSAQALFGATEEFEDDGEPRAPGPRGDGDGNGAGAAAAASLAATAAAATTAAAPAAAPAAPAAFRGYSTLSTLSSSSSSSSNGSNNNQPERRDDGEAADDDEGGAATAGADADADADGGSSVGSELHAVNTAIRANALIFLAKLAVAVASSSAAMFAEAVHSLVDVANQTLLRVGILKARRAPTEAHPLGFARDQFIWPLISAVGIFCCGAGVSLVHGVAGLLEPARELGDLTASYAVLAVSLALESHSLAVALQTLKGRARRRGLSLLQYLRTGADPAATAVMMEDGAAVAGLLIAGGCLALCQITGSAAWDSAGSVAVALLLGGVAVTLIQRNRLFLIGRAMPPESERRVLRYLESDPVIRRVRNARSEELGVHAYRFYGEIAFDGGEVARRALDRVGRRRLFGALAAAAAARDAARMDALMTAYSAAVVSATGAEVDRLERQICALVPGIKHVDLETDREAAGAPRRRLQQQQQQQQRQAAAEGQDKDKAEEALAAAEASGPSSSADDEVYGGAQLLFGEDGVVSGEAWGWEGGQRQQQQRAAPGVGGGEAAADWLALQLPPDGSVEARRARPSMSAAAFRTREREAGPAAEAKKGAPAAPAASSY